MLTMCLPPITPTLFFVPVEVHQHGRALSGRQLLDGLVMYHDPGVIAGDGNGCFKRHAARLGCHRPFCLSSAGSAFAVSAARIRTAIAFLMPR
jgi:hypothetical protein